MSVLTLSGVSKQFGNNVALSDVSLRIDSGEFICLLGASGCGKTTLLRIIAGLTTHDHGTLRLNDRDLAGVPCHKRNIGMVFQSLALFPHLDVGHNIAYGPRMRGATREAIDSQINHLLEMVGLPDFAARPISSLSGGQKQRVAIARALALEPQLFLMDEPFSALDAGLREHLQQEVKSLQQQLGITTVFVTHDQREAMALADRVVVLNNGAIEQTGTPAQIYLQPATRFVAEFIGANNLLDVEISTDRVQLAGNDLGHPQAALSTISGHHTIAIRPESIRLTREKEFDAGNPGSLVGTVVTSRPVGALIEHKIEIPGQVIKQTSFQDSATRFAPGDKVEVSWDWSKIWVLPA